MEPTARPDRLGPYQLTEWLGQSGMANLYRARLSGPRGFEKTVLVKAMLPALVEDSELVDRFTAQAQTTARLSHPGILQVHDYQLDRGMPYIVSEHADGLNLAQLMAAVAASGRRLPVGVAVVIATEICQALALGHGWRDPEGIVRQIIHCDLSPDGVMVCRDGSIKLLDFGMARIVEQLDFEVLVKSKGNFAYMAPEQVNRLPFDCRVDVFSAGAVLHEMLTGRRLFGAPSDLETLRRIDAAEVAPPSRYNADVLVTLDGVVLKALARNPDDRFSDGAQMAAALEQFRFDGGGRRRVAEFLGSLFPERGHTHCEVCRKELVLVPICVHCGNDLPAKPLPAADPPTVRVEPPAVLIDMTRERPAPPVRPPPPPRPRSVTMRVDPAVIRRPARGWLRSTLLGAAIGVLATVVGLEIATRRQTAEPRATLPAPVAIPHKALEPTSPLPAAPAPKVASEPAAIAGANEPARHKHSPRVVQRALPRLPPPPPLSPTPEEPPRVERLPMPPPSGAKDPRLLDPFGR